MFTYSNNHAEAFDTAGSATEQPDLSAQFRNVEARTFVERRLRCRLRHPKSSVMDDWSFCHRHDSSFDQHDHTMSIFLAMSEKFIITC
jgi:hypothetical protein